jgi:hypothetical protein
MASTDPEHGDVYGQYARRNGQRGAVAVPAALADVGIELREGYAAVGDQSLHYVEAGDGRRSFCCTAFRSSSAPN